MVDKKILKGVVRVVVRGDKLPTLSWPALKAELLESEIFSEKELEKERTYIIERFLEERSQQDREKLLGPEVLSKSSSSGETISENSNNDSGFNESMQDSNSGSECESESTSISEGRPLPTVDTTKDNRVPLLDVFVNGWQGAGLRYGNEPDSFIRTRWAEENGLHTDGDIVLRWKLNDSSESHKTVFIPHEGLESLKCDFLFGTKFLDPSWRRADDQSTSQDQKIETGHSPPGAFAIPLTDSMSPIQSTQAWVNRTTPNTALLADLVFQLELKYRDSGDFPPAFVPQQQGGVIGECSSNNSRRASQGPDSCTHSKSSRRPRSKTRLSNSKTHPT